jgi:hypothetical protein
VGEIDKVVAHHEETQAIGEFLDWMKQRGWHVLEDVTFYEWQDAWNQQDSPVYGPPAPRNHANYVFRRCGSRQHSREAHWCVRTSRDYGYFYEVHEWMRPRGTIEEWLAGYIGVDLKKLEQERRAVLESIREARE